MPALGFPQTFAGNLVRGRLEGARGLIHNVHLESNPYEPMNPVMAWTHESPDADQLAADNIVKVFRDGLLEQTIYGYTKAILGSLRQPDATGQATRPGQYVTYDLLAVSPLEDALSDYPNNFRVNPMGSRAEMSWTECTAQDFNAYQIYWDAGSPGGTLSLLQTITARGMTLTFSPQLTHGSTYRFALGLKDDKGNTTGRGTAYSVTATTPPLALTGATVSVYGTTTRKATITATQPAGQHSDVAGVALYDNYLPGIGLSEYPNVDFQFRRKFFYGTANPSFATQELHEGQWKFALRVVDKAGNQSEFSTLTINVKANRTRGSAQPLAPMNLTAYATANGGMILTWAHDGANVTAYKAYTGGTLNTTSTASLTTSPHRLALTGLTDGQPYTFWLLAANGGVNSGSSNAATGTADASAPAGSRALILELV